MLYTSYIYNQTNIRLFSTQQQNMKLVSFLKNFRIKGEVTKNSGVEVIVHIVKQHDFDTRIQRDAPLKLGGIVSSKVFPKGSTNEKTIVRINTSKKVNSFRSRDFWRTPQLTSSFRKKGGPVEHYSSILGNKQTLRQWRENKQINLVIDIDRKTNIQTMYNAFLYNQTIDARVVGFTKKDCILTITGFLVMLPITNRKSYLLAYENIKTLKQDMNKFQSYLWYFIYKRYFFKINFNKKDQLSLDLRIKRSYKRTLHFLSQTGIFSKQLDRATYLNQEVILSAKQKEWRESFLLKKEYLNSSNLEPSEKVKYFDILIYDFVDFILSLNNLSEKTFLISLHLFIYHFISFFISSWVSSLGQGSLNDSYALSSFDLHKIAGKFLPIKIVSLIKSPYFNIKKTDQFLNKVSPFKGVDYRIKIELVNDLEVLLMQK